MTHLDSIEIDGLIWTDKHAWSGIAASEHRASDGALVIQTGVMKKGRPITLQGEQTCWLQQSQLEQLQALTATGQAFDFQRGSFSARVMFRYSESPVLEVEPLWQRSDTEDPNSAQILYILKTIKLIEV